MSNFQPFRALRSHPAVAGPLDRLVSPPYDVIDAERRAELAARSPHNVVAVDLPEHEDYDGAAARFDAWKQEGAIVRDEAPALWVLRQDYTGPDGEAKSRTGFFARIRVEEDGPGRIRPHERPHPGPKEDRLRLTRATKANMSPILCSTPARRSCT